MWLTPYCLWKTEESADIRFPIFGFRDLCYTRGIAVMTLCSDKTGLLLRQDLRQDLIPRCLCLSLMIETVYLCMSNTRWFLCVTSCVQTKGHEIHENCHLVTFHFMKKLIF